MQPQPGEKSASYTTKVTQESLKSFADAVGSLVDLSKGAPPTFMTTCRKGEFELFTRLGVPLAKILHTDQEYHYGRAILAGDELVYETVLGHVAVKKAPSGPLTFMRFDTVILINRGTTQLQAGTSKTTLIVRGDRPVE